MATSVKGGCACRAVRYESSAEPVLMGNCHCRDCQQASGSAFVSLLGVPKPALKITGDVKYYDVKGDSGKTVSRGFCPNCGSRLFGRAAIAPDLMVIYTGSLDDSSWYKPTMDIYTASAQPWDHMNPSLQKFPKMPPMG